MKWLRILVVSCFIAGIFSGCVSTRSQIYHEPSINKQEINATRIAIVPNRLPLNLENPEKWRYYNWRIAAEYLNSRGYQIVDYKTSVKAFDNSGLRVEDTKSSRDKYAELANDLSVDIIVVPYYGTFATASTALFWTVMKWTSVTTFQFYSADKNDFITRLDMSGKDTYVSGIGTLIGTVFTLVASEEPDLAMVGGIVILAGTVVDLVNTVFVSNDAHWGRGFKSSIRNGLIPFVRTYPSQRTGRVKEFSQPTETKKAAAEVPEPVKETIKTDETAPAITAEVINVKPGELLVDKGTSDGVKVGQECKIYSGDATLNEQQKIGVGYIDRVRTDMAVVKTTAGTTFKKGDTCSIVVN